MHISTIIIDYILKFFFFSGKMIDLLFYTNYTNTVLCRGILILRYFNTNSFFFIYLYFATISNIFLYVTTIIRLINCLQVNYLINAQLDYNQFHKDNGKYSCTYYARPKHRGHNNFIFTVYLTKDYLKFQNSLNEKKLPFYKGLALSHHRHA